MTKVRPAASWTLLLLLCLALRAEGVPDASQGPRRTILRYRGQPGRVAQYQLALRIAGEQVSLGERRPVRIEAQLELREEVIATGPESTFLLRIRARPLEVKDPTGTFAKPDQAVWPELLLWTTAHGETLTSSPAAADRGAGPFQRSFASLMTTPLTVILPVQEVSVGESWKWEKEGTGQQGRLLSLTGVGATSVARLSSTVAGPIALREESEALGLVTEVRGSQTQTSQLELLLGPGIVLRHKGELRLRTNSEVLMRAPGGARVFPAHSDVTIRFDLRLVGLDGGPIARG